MARNVNICVRVGATLRSRVRKILNIRKYLSQLINLNLTNIANKIMLKLVLVSIESMCYVQEIDEKIYFSINSILIYSHNIKNQRSKTIEIQFYNRSERS